jgi:hypothetical protein
MILRTQEEEELWKQVIIALLGSARSDNYTSSDAIDAADEVIKNYRDRH